MLPADLVVERCVASREEGGRTVVLAPRDYGRVIGWLIKRWLGARPVQVKLDDLGAHVWARCDGATPVSAIATSLADAFPDRAEEVEARLEVFLNTMHREGWVRYLQPAGAEGEGDG